MNPSFSVQDDYPASIVLNFQEILKKLNDEDFEDFCRQNPDLKIELTKEGELIVMPPIGGRTGYRNFSLIVEFGKWSEKDGTGVGFDSSTVFVLPSGAKRSPDLAWVSNERWNSLSNEEQEKFPPLCPDFVVELRSRTDLLFTLQEKMREYVENGAQLGWLIDPSEKKVYVYRQRVETEILDNPLKVSGEPLLKEFALDIKKIW
jgi:Uma2 family endonuclease